MKRNQGTFINSGRYAPAIIFIKLAVTIFIGEVIVMGILSWLYLPKSPFEWVLDATLLSVITFPFIYVLVVHPFRQAQRTIAVSEKNLATTLHSIGDAVIVTDVAGRATRMNPVAAHLTGWSLEEALGQPMEKVFNIINEETREPVQNPFQRVLREGKIVGLANHTALISKDGTVYPIGDSAAPIRDDQGNLTGVVMVFRDMTKERQAVEALRESNERVRLLLDSTGEAIYGLDLKGNCTFCNPACLRLLGYQHESDLLGENMHDLIHHTRPDGAPYPVESCRIYEAFHWGEGTHVDDEVLWRADGSSFPAEYWSYPIHQHGEVVGSVVTFVDITDRKRGEEALRQSEERFRTLADQALDGIFLLDMEGRILDANRQAYESLGYSHDELTRLNIADVDVEVISREHRKRFWEQLVQGQTAAFEGVHRRKDGTTFPVDVRLGLLKSEPGRNMIGLARDITERKRAEEVLRQSESELSAIYDSAPLVMILVDEERRVHKVNRTACEMTGRRAEEMIGLRGGEALRCVRALDDPTGCGFGPACETCVVRNTVLDTFRTGNAHHRAEATIPFDREDGTVNLQVLVSTKPLKLAERAMVLVCLEDITERKRGEDRLRFLSSIVEQASEGMVVADLEGNVLFANQAWARVHGYDTTMDLLGQNIKTFHTQEQFEHQVLPSIEAVNAAGYFRGEIEHARADGTVFPTLTSTTRIRNKSTLAVTLASIVTDITVHKQAEEARIKLLQIEEERNHLKSALQAFEQVLGVVGHELRTPLAAVRASAELLLDEESDETAESGIFVKNIHDEVVRMAQVVDDLVEVARVNSGVARWNWSEFSVGHTCDEAIKILRPLVDQNKVELVSRVDPDDLVMRGDSSAIRRLVVNLLNNAYKHTSEGSISVLASNLSIGGLDWVQIVVSDTGHGMSPEVAARLGEAFALNSGVVGESHVQGSGLGLAICRGIVAAHGGTISVSTVPNKGTSVTVLLRSDLPGPAVAAQAANIVCEVQQ